MTNQMDRVSWSKHFHLLCATCVWLNSGCWSPPALWASWTRSHDHHPQHPSFWLVSCFNEPSGKLFSLASI